MDVRTLRHPEGSGATGHEISGMHEMDGIALTQNAYPEVVDVSGINSPTIDLSRQLCHQCLMELRQHPGHLCLTSSDEDGDDGPCDTCRERGEKCFKIPRQICQSYPQFIELLSMAATFASEQCKQQAAYPAKVAEILRQKDQRLLDTLVGHCEHLFLHNSKVASLEQRFEIEERSFERQFEEEKRQLAVKLKGEAARHRHLAEKALADLEIVKKELLETRTRAEFAQGSYNKLQDKVENDRADWGRHRERMKAESREQKRRIELLQTIAQGQSQVAEPAAHHRPVSISSQAGPSLQSRAADAAAMPPPPPPPRVVPIETTAAKTTPAKMAAKTTRTAQKPSAQKMSVKKPQARPKRPNSAPKRHQSGLRERSPGAETEGSTWQPSSRRRTQPQSPTKRRTSLPRSTTITRKNYYVPPPSEFSDVSTGH